MEPQQGDRLEFRIQAANTPIPENLLEASAFATRPANAARKLATMFAQEIIENPKNKVKHAHSIKGLVIEIRSVHKVYRYKVEFLAPPPSEVGLGDRRITFRFRPSVIAIPNPKTSLPHVNPNKNWLEKMTYTCYRLEKVTAGTKYITVN